MVGSPLVSVVIVNWNRLDDVLKTLHYLGCQRGVRYEVVVVDNGSSDGSAERLSQLGSIKVVSLTSNEGPAKARNIGVEHATGKYILFLDSDAVISKVGLAKLVARMESDPTIAVAGCRIINSYTRKLDQWIYQQPAATHEHTEFETFAFSAAGALIRSDAIRAAGPFWDDLFIYNEEIDLSIRVLRAGYRIIYFPEARVFHANSNHGRSGPSLYWYQQIRNWIWIYYRYYDSFSCFKKVSLYIIAYVIKGIYNGHLNACLSGIRDGLARTVIRRQYPDKLTGDEMRRIDALGRRRFRLRGVEAVAWRSGRRQLCAVMIGGDRAARHRPVPGVGGWGAVPPVVPRRPDPGPVSGRAEGPRKSPIDRPIVATPMPSSPTRSGARSSGHREPAIRGQTRCSKTCSSDCGSTSSIAACRSTTSRTCPKGL